MNVAKHLVSKKKKRFYDGEFDLDLSYIKPNIIAMAFPAENFESVYRNNMDDVVRFLKLKHNDNFRVYNLCSERDYDHNKFDHRVEKFPFDDHNPPPFSLIGKFCSSIDKYLSSDLKNTAVVHCKAGKGRTGVMICSYLLHSQRNWSFKEALDFYAAARTHNSKGVTIPSQLRFIFYYDFYLKWQALHNKVYYSIPLFVHKVVLSAVPIPFTTFFFHVFNNSTIIFKSKLTTVKKNDHFVVFNLGNYLPIVDDIRFEFYQKDRMKKAFLFQFWINTFFISEGHLNSQTLLNSLSIESSFQQKCYGLDPFYCSNAIFNSDVSDNTKTQSISLNVQGSPDFPSSTNLVYTIHKTGLDRANKDSSHRTFTSDFRVQLLMYDVPDGCMNRTADTRLIQTTNSLEHLNFNEKFSSNNLKNLKSKSTIDIANMQLSDEE